MVGLNAFAFMLACIAIWITRRERRHKAWMALFMVLAAANLGFVIGMVAS